MEFSVISGAQNGANPEKANSDSHILIPEGEYETLKSDVKVLRAKVETLQQEIDSLRQESARKDTEHTAVQQLLNVEQREREQAQEKLEAEKRRILILHEQLAAAEQRERERDRARGAQVPAAPALTAIPKSREDELQRANEHLSAQCRDLTAKVKTLEAQYTALSQDAQKCKLELDQKRQQCDALAQRFKTEHDQGVRRQREEEEMRFQMTQELERLRTQIDSAQNAQELQQSTMRFREKNDEFVKLLQEENEQLRAHTRRLSSEIESMQQFFQRIEPEIFLMSLNEGVRKRVRETVALNATLTTAEEAKRVYASEIQNFLNVLKGNANTEFGVAITFQVVA